LEPHLEHEDVVVVVFDVKHFGHDAAPLLLRIAGLLGHLAVIRLASLRAPGANWSARDTWAHPTNASPPEGRQPPTVSLGRNHDFEGIECEVDHTLCAEWECGTHLHVRLIMRVSPLPSLTDQDIRQRG